MIISKKKKFIFLKTAKTAGSSIEFYLSQFCGENDTITSLSLKEEKLKKKLKLAIKQNYEYETIKFGFKNFKKLDFSKKIILNDHSSLNVLENKLKLDLKKYYIFAFVRNPYHWITSYFWWYLYHEKILDLKNLNRLSKREINLLFKFFLKSQCGYWFNWMKDIIYSKKYKVHIFKFEDLEKNISKLNNILSLNDEKIKFGKFKLKDLNINARVKQKIKFDKESIKLIKVKAKYFFKRFRYSNKPPKIYNL